MRQHFDCRASSFVSSVSDLIWSHSLRLLKNQDHIRIEPQPVEGRLLTVILVVVLPHLCLTVLYLHISSLDTFTAEEKSPEYNGSHKLLESYSEYVTVEPKLHHCHCSSSSLLFLDTRPRHWLLGVQTCMRCMPMYANVWNGG